jgi:hypothetical protein
MQRRNFLTTPRGIFLTAMVCCFLWGSAFPSIKIGYALFRMDTGHIPTQLYYAGLRFALAGVLTILMGSAAQKKPLFPGKGAWRAVLIMGGVQTVIQYLFGKHKIFDESLQGLIDRKTFKLDSVPEQLFVLWRQEDIRKFTDRLPVERLHFVGTDMYTKYFEDMVDGLNDAEFEQYMNYQFAVCERADMVGISHHTLDILRKKG